MDEIRNAIFMKFTQVADAVLFRISRQPTMNSKSVLVKFSGRDGNKVPRTESRGILKRRPPARDTPMFHENDIYT